MVFVLVFLYGSTGFFSALLLESMLWAVGVNVSPPWLLPALGVAGGIVVALVLTGASR